MTVFRPFMGRMTRENEFEKNIIKDLAKTWPTNGEHLKLIGTFYMNRKRAQDIIDEMGMSTWDWQIAARLFGDENEFRGCDERSPRAWEYIELVWWYMYETMRTLPDYLEFHYRRDIAIISLNWLIYETPERWSDYQQAIMSDGGKERFEALKAGVPLEDLVA